MMSLQNRTQSIENELEAELKIQEPQDKEFHTDMEGKDGIDCFPQSYNELR